MPLAMRGGIIEWLLASRRMPATPRKLARDRIHGAGAVADLDDVPKGRERLAMARLGYGAGVKGRALAGVAADGMALLADAGADALAALELRASAAEMPNDGRCRIARLQCFGGYSRGH